MTPTGLRFPVPFARRGAPERRTVLARLTGPIALAALLAGAGLIAPDGAAAQDKALLNASYDVGRELFAAINPKFLAAWSAQNGGSLKLDQSFAGTSRQAQDIIQGKRVDIVTFNQVTDVNLLAERGFIGKDWARRFPNNSSPYYSTIAFLVRKGNPKGIKGWDDLVRDDVKLVFPNPKTSGNARYSYLGAWLHALQKYGGDEAKARQFVARLLANVENFPTGGRGATVAFAQNGQGDALLSFESEVVNIAGSDEFKAGGFEVVVPASSVLAEFPVAVVDRIVDAKGTRNEAEAYLRFQYTPEIQRLLTTFNLRVHDPDVVRATAAQFPKVTLVDPAEKLGGWDAIQKTHFANGGVLDELLSKRR